MSQSVGVTLRQLETSSAGVESKVEPVRRFYRPELDLLRFGAFLMVFTSHAVPRRVEEYSSLGLPESWLTIMLSAAAASGAYGVDVFFALSSYLITTLLLQEYARYGSIDVRAFYARRILRIWPLYFAFLLIVVPILNATFPREQLTIGYLAAFLLLAGNWAYALGSPPPSSAAPLWSVSIEEQFYLLWPLIMRRWFGHGRTIAVGMLIVASLTRIALILFQVAHPGTWYNTLTRLDPLAVGILVAIGLESREWAPSRWQRLLLAGGGGALIYSVGLWGATDGTRALFSYPLVAVASAALILSVLGVRLRPSPSLRLFVHLGRISYGLYVFHMACMAVFWKSHPSVVRGLGGKVAGFLLTVIIAMLSYRYFESPFLRLKERFARVRAA